MTGSCGAVMRHRCPDICMLDLVSEIILYCIAVYVFSFPASSPNSTKSLNMPNRSQDWMKQARRDLEQAIDSQKAERHEWACFAVQQAAEKAVKALHLHCGQKPGGILLPASYRTFPNRRTHENNLWRKPRFSTICIFQRDTQTATRRARLLSTMAVCRAQRQSNMPVRSLNTAVFKWPDKVAVDAAFRRWGKRVGRLDSSILAIVTLVPMQLGIGVWVAIWMESLSWKHRPKPLKDVRPTLAHLPFLSAWTF